MLRALAPGAVFFMILSLAAALQSATYGWHRLDVVIGALALLYSIFPPVLVASTRLRVDGTTTITLSTMGRITSTTPVRRGLRIAEGEKGWHIADADGRLEADLGSVWDREQMSRLARHLGLVYEKIASPPSTALSRPDGVEQLRLQMSPGRARWSSWPVAAVFLGVSILDCAIDKSLASLPLALPLVGIFVAWPFYRQPRTYLVADARTVRIYRPFFPVKQIARQEIGMVTKSGKICDRAGRLLGTETPWTRDQVSQLRAFLGVPLVEDDVSCGG